MATQKYAIGAQGPGYVSFDGPITDASTTAPIVHLLNIPSGMINIGGLGKGYVIDADPSFQFVGNLADNQYIIYARKPVDSDPGGSATGKAIVDSSTVKTFNTYAVLGLGDTASQRAFCYFRVRNGLIDEESILTFRSGTTTRKTTETFPGIEDPILRTLEKMGFYVNGTTDFNYTKRGQYVDEEVTFDDPNVNQWDLVYKGDGDIYFQAISNDTLAEKVIGIADIDRSLVVDFNFVIASGFVDIGTVIPSGSTQQNILDTASFPAGTYLYLSGATAGKIVRDFDAWEAGTSYTLGKRIAESGFVWESSGGISAGSIPAFSSISGLGIGSTINDNTITPWTAIAIHDPVFIPIEDGGVARKIRIGTALGSGVMLLTPGATSIDDHDEAANAHPDIQLAIEKAGIYVVNTNQGLPVTDVEYRGQGFHEEATFSSMSPDDRLLVYRHSGGTYQKAIAGISGEASENVIGISYNIDESAQPNTVLTSGFVNVDTSAIAVGEPIYLSDSVAGALSATPGGVTGDTGIRVGTCIASATRALGGLMLLHLGSGEELDNHNESVDAHSAFQLSLAQSGVFVASSALYSHQFVGQAFDKLAGGNSMGTVSYGDAVYLATTTYEPAIADATAAQTVVGIAVNESGSGTPDLVAASGYINVGTGSGKLDGSFSVGDDVYLSSTTPGDFTPTPTNVKLGIALGGGVLLLSSIGLAAGLGDVTFEDVTYQVIIGGLAYNAMFYDIFDETNTLDSVSSGLSYDANTTAYVGGPGDKIVHTVPFGSGNLHDKVLIHVETDSSFTLELDFGSGFGTVVADTDVLSDNGDINSVTFRFTFGSGGGSLFSYGLFFDDEDPPFPLARLHEVDILTAPAPASTVLTIPNSEQYIDNGKSLQVFRQASGDNGGMLQTLGTDYSETSSSQITVDVSGGWASGDVITYIENYTQIDVSKDNTVRLNLEHDIDGNHILRDKITSIVYYLEIHDGILQITPV